MAKAARFDNSFLATQVERRKKWKQKGVKAGHGGDFDIDGVVKEMNRVSNTVSNGLKDIVPKAPSSTVATALIDTSDIPNWMVKAMQTDSEVAFAATNKKVTKDQVPSPHKRRIGQGIRNEKERTSSQLKEHWIQVRLFYMLERYYPEEYELVFAVPNGGLRSARTASLMMYEGQMEGVPDIMVMMPRGKYHGLMLEVKTDTGSTSKKQKEVQERFRKQGYLVVTMKGFDACWQLLKDYINLPTFDGESMIPEIA